MLEFAMRMAEKLMCPFEIWLRSMTEDNPTLRGSNANSQDEAQILDLSISRSQLSSKNPASEENATGSPNNDDSFSDVQALTMFPPLRYGNPVSH